MASFLHTKVAPGLEGTTSTNHCSLSLEGHLTGICSVKAEPRMASAFRFLLPRSPVTFPRAQCGPHLRSSLSSCSVVGKQLRSIFSFSEHTVAAWRGVSTRRGRAVMRGLSGAGVLLEGKEKGTEPS